MKSFEIEQKYRCSDLSKIRAQLKKMGAKLIKKGIEQNEFWDRKGELGKKKTVLRLRRHEQTAELTLKGPKLKSHFTKRIELETKIEYEPAQAILTALGFKISKKYSKQREVYLLKQVMVTLDALPRFGTFIELEGSVQNIKRLAAQLGISDNDREERSYLAMVFAGRFYEKA